MSGPKVVRVVSREERISQGERILAGLNLAHERWVQGCSSQDLATPAQIEEARERRNRLEAMLRADQFDRFTAAATGEAGFLSADLEAKLLEAAQARERLARRHSEGRKLARQLISQADRNASPYDPDLIASLNRGADGGLDIDELDRTLAKALRQRMAIAPESLSEEHRQLALRLIEGTAQSPTPQWTWHRSLDPRHEQALQHISALGVLDPDQDLQSLRMRLESISELADDVAQSVRYDSVLIELISKRRHLTSQAKLVAAADSISAEMLALGLSESSLFAALSSASMKSPAEEIEKLIGAARDLMDSEQKVAAASARRFAVLKGLEALGYEIAEGMETVLCDEGRVVIRSPHNPEYGVELAGGRDLDRMQVRAVALSASLDKSQDLPAESKWCDDFGRLSKSLADRGDALLIERALGVGAVPLKVVGEIEANERAKVARPVVTSKRS